MKGDINIEFRVGMSGIQFDQNYGAARRTGFSIFTGGHYWVELEPNPLKAAWKFLKAMLGQRK